MIKYKVKSGSMSHTIETPYPADALTIAALALHEARKKDKSRTLGVLLEVSGGQYVGDALTYVLTEQVCRKIGRMAPEESTT